MGKGGKSDGEEQNMAAWLVAINTLKIQPFTLPALALGSSSVTSSSPPTVVDRPLFSNVARLGFASAHDSPTLRTEETNMSSGSSTALPTGGTSSFANVISRAKPVETKAIEIGGKKGKKASRESCYQPLVVVGINKGDTHYLSLQTP